MFITIESFLLLVAVVESVVETVKWLFVIPSEEAYRIAGKVSLWKIVTLFASVTMAIATGADLISYLGIPMGVPYIGSFLTGVLLARGAGVLHDLAKLAKPAPVGV